MNLIRFCLAVGLCFPLSGVLSAQDSANPDPVKHEAAKEVSSQPNTPIAETPAVEPPIAENASAETPAEKKPAVLNPENDTSYWLLGEFIGDVKESGDDDEENVASRMGLQLRPVGETDFDAQMFEGGLPGEGISFADEPTQDPIGTPREPMRLVGRRSGKMLVLSGGPYAIFVDAGGCTLIDPAGKQLGRLDRVNRASASLGAPAPAGAIVLFGEEGDTSNLVDAKLDSDGMLKQGFSIKPMIQDFDFHIEFRTPYMPAAKDQKRGNSGIYIHGRYEMQILDSFAQAPKVSDLGSIYRVKAPDLNMALPPLSWQTYDVHFTAARYNADGSKYANARVTTWVNGVKVQNDIALESHTGHGKPEAPILLPILLQDHNDEVRFRNLWIIDRGLVRTEFPVVGNAKQPPLVLEDKEDKAGQNETAETKANQSPSDTTAVSEQTEVKTVSDLDALPLETPIVRGNAEELPAPIVN